MNACVGLHPYGPCPPGVGCNRPADPVDRRVAELEAELREERESHAATWKRAGENGRLLIESRGRMAALEAVAVAAREAQGTGFVQCLDAPLAALDAGVSS